MSILSTGYVPQGSILGPVMFNIYVADLSEVVKNSTCVQYADDSSLYDHCKPRNLPSCIQRMTENLEGVIKWSKSTNLIFNSIKTKSMLFSTTQMNRIHNLNRDDVVVLKPCDQEIARVKSYKILGMTFTENMTWNTHIDNATKSAYHTLRTLNHLKRFTPFHVRKMLAESLVLSRIQYGNAIFFDAPAYLIKKLQRIQNTAAAFVLRRYAKEEDVIKLKWLPVKENIEYSIAKMAYKAINDETWPTYLKLNKKEQTTTLNRRSAYASTATTILQGMENGSTFENVASKTFNELPPSSRSATTYTSFCSNAKKYFHDKALARTLSQQT